MDTKRITSEHPLSQSADIVGDNIEQLKQLFPSVFTEGKIDFAALRDILGDEVETDPEYYRFTWPGKQKAKAEARKPSRGTLRPAPEESVDWDSTQNLYIEGDNLEVLKLLQKSYAGKVKMIYIDPPYNTGKDFVYKDNYKDNLANYNEQFNRYDEEGNLKSSAAETNQEGHARYHSNWLNMMYPRLTLARNLLTEDGVIFISIDDNEIENLTRICNEIYGESNFIARLTVLCNPKGRAQDKYFAANHEYILVFSKNEQQKGAFNIPKTEEQLKSEYKSQDNIGYYRALELRNTHREFGKFNRPNLYYPLYVDPNDQSVALKKSNSSQVEVLPNWADGFEGCWTWGEPKVASSLNFLVGKLVNDVWKVYVKDYAEDSTRKLKTILKDKLYTTEKGQKAFNDLFHSKGKLFQSPKSIELLKVLLLTKIGINSIVLDFFSGSASTAHAVMELNAEDNGDRKYIQVQLPESTSFNSEAYKEGFTTITDIGKERIRRAGKKILEEKPELKGKLDVGFKVFKLDESNIKTWETDPEKLEQNLLLEDVIKDDRSEEDVIYEILLKYGLDLTLPLQKKDVSTALDVTTKSTARGTGSVEHNVSSSADEHNVSSSAVENTLYAIGGGALLVCLDDKLTPATAQAILDWKEELGAVNPKVVFKESGFNNSQDKVNALQLLKTNEITDVWSI